MLRIQVSCRAVRVRPLSGYNGNCAKKVKLIADSIVAVHGLNEDSIDAWTDPQSGINWLRDLLPNHIQNARILTYGYDASVSSFFGSNAAVTIQRIAECLVQELYANRKLEGMRKRPIIFICHGLGGVLVKKSLVYASTRTAPKVDHLWDQYISTFAVLFFGTPHDYTSKSNWLALESCIALSQRQIIDSSQRVWPEFSNLSIEGDRYRESQGSDAQTDEHMDMQFFKAITGEFMPLMRQLRMFFFWEELKTAFKGRKSYIVDHSSAVLDLDNTEKAGVYATHIQMIKFGSPDASAYRTVLEALTRYCGDSQKIIDHRWTQAIPALHRLRAGEAFELGGFESVIQPDEQFLSPNPPARGPTIHHFYPPQEASPGFIGRNDMFQKVYDTLFPDSEPATTLRQNVFVVHGMGGSGKTQFCSKMALDCKNRYYAVFTIHAASSETIKDSLARIGKIGGLEATESAGKHFLTQLTRLWLLVIDNADDPSLDLQSLFPQSRNAHVLVTTRNPDFRKLGTLGHLEFRGLKEDEALQLLFTRADIPEPWDQSTLQAGSLIAKSLGYLALALIHAGTCIYRRICGLGDYLNLHLASRRSIVHQNRLSGTHKTNEQDDLIHAVYSTFDVSRDFLSKKQTMRSRDASELLKIIGFYHFESIPIEIFTRAITIPQDRARQYARPSFASRLSTAITQRLQPPKLLPQMFKREDSELGRYRITAAISELQSLSLIHYDAQGGSFSLHPLVHSWARDSMSKAERQVWTAISFNILMEAISLPSEGHGETDGEFHTEMLPHLDICLQQYGNPLSLSISNLSSCKLLMIKVFQPTYLFILREEILSTAKCGYVMADRGRFKIAVEYLEVVKDTLLSLVGPMNEKTMGAMLGMAAVCWGLGRLEEAISLQSQVVTTRTMVYGPEDERTLQAMDQLGRSYWLHGQYQEALVLQQLTAERMKTTLGHTHPQTLAALDNLGVTLSAWHRFDESRQIHEEVLNAREKAIGETHLDTLATKSNLAMALKDLGYLDDAKAAMSVVHAERRKKLGKEHPWTLWALCYLAKIHTEMGLLHEAEEMLTWGCEAGERSLSKDHLGVLMGRGELCRIYARQGRLAEAHALCTKTLELIATSRGLAHPDCVYATYKLAQLQELKKDTHKAVSLCHLALERADMRITRIHPIAKKIEILLHRLQSSLLSDQSEVPDAIDEVSEQRAFRYRGIRAQKTW